MSATGELQSLVDVLASMGRETAGALHGGAEYVGSRIEGDPASASQALAIGRDRAGDDWYVPGPEGEAVNQELIDALAGVVGGVDQSIPMVGEMGEAAMRKLDDMPPDFIAGMEMIAAPMDITPAAVFAALPLAFIRSAKNMPASKVYELFHGSQHTFDKPDLSRAQTGTGHQRQGHGLYLTDEEDVARHYADYTSGVPNFMETDIGGMNYEQFVETLTPEENAIFQRAWGDIHEGVARGHADIDPGQNVYEDLSQYIGNKDYGLYEDPDYLAWNQEAAESLVAKLPNDIIVPEAADPQVYKFGVRGTDLQRTMDFDAPLADQQHVIDAVGADPDIGDFVDQVIEQGGTGRHLYEMLEKEFGGREAASEFLRRSGIPGHTVKDRGHGYQQSSPDANEYVMYDTEAVIPMERNGEELTAALAARLDPDAPFNEYALEYPPVAQSVMAYDKTSPPPTSRAKPKPMQATKPVDPETGKRTTEPGRPYSKAWPAKGKNPEGVEFMKERNRVAAEVKAGDYEPYFNVDERTDATAWYNDRPQYPMPKKQETVDKWRAEVKTPEAKQRLVEAYNAGVESGGHDAWYKMGQLEQEFIDELGPIEGPRMFAKRFGEAMAATTGGADPTGNLLMATFGNFMNQRGRRLPTEVRDTPVPIGGRFSKGNLSMYEKAINEGKGIAHAPKRSSFKYNFMGNDKYATIDEHMTEIMTPGLQSPPGDSYFAYEELIRETAEELGISPRELQEVAWGGRKATLEGGYDGKPMIEIVNEAIARTSKLTGASPKDVVRRGLVRADMPIYGAAGAVGLGGLAAALANSQEPPPEMY